MPVALFGICLTFMLLATWFSLVVPVLEAPDEPPHFLFVSNILLGRGLPVLTVNGEDNVAGQEGVQPPLYYMLGAALAFWTDPRDFQDWQLTNWHQNVDRSRPGNKNLLVHTDREQFPFQGAILSLHVVRLLSVGLGTLSVFLTYLIARESGLRQSLALATAAVVAFNPQFVFLSSVVNNDSAGAAASALVLFCAVKIVQLGASDRRLMFLSLAVGVGLLGKLSGLALVPMAIIAWWLGRRHVRRAILRDLFLLAVPALAVAGWWYLRNFLTYGDPLGWDRMLLAIDPILRRNIRLEDFLAEAIALKESSWAVFGWRNIAVDGWIYAALDLAVLIGLLGLVRAYWPNRAKPISGEGPESRVSSSDIRPQMGLALFLLAWIVVFCVSLIRWSLLVEHTGQGRLLFPTLPAFAILLVTGLAGCMPRHKAVLPWLFAGGLATLTVAAGIVYIPAAYPAVRFLSEREASAVPNQTRARFGDLAELIGYRFEPETISAGEDSWLVLYWRAVGVTTQDIDVNLRVVARDYRPILEESSYPALGARPFPLWRVGEVVEDRRLIRVPRAIAVPDYLRVELSLRPREATDARFEIRDPTGSKIGDRMTLGPLRVRSSASWPPAGSQSAGARFGKGMVLDSLRVERTANDNVTVSLYWSASTSAPVNQGRVSVTLADQLGRQIATSAGEPGDGWYPTDLWKEGEHFDDEQDLAIPSDLPPGQYRLAVEVKDKSMPAESSGRSYSASVLLR